jgi:hypothetical protein
MLLLTAIRQGITVMHLITALASIIRRIAITVTGLTIVSGVGLDIMAGVAGIAGEAGAAVGVVMVDGMAGSRSVANQSISKRNWTAKL